LAFCNLLTTERKPEQRTACLHAAVIGRCYYMGLRTEDATG